MNILSIDSNTYLSNSRIPSISIYAVYFQTPEREWYLKQYGIVEVVTATYENKVLVHFESQERMIQFQLAYL